MALKNHPTLALPAARVERGKHLAATLSEQLIPQPNPGVLAWLLILFFGSMMLLWLVVFWWLVLIILAIAFLFPEVRRSFASWRRGRKNLMTVEASGVILDPGMTFDVAVVHAKRPAVSAMEVTLVLEEEVKYRQGTDTVTDRKDVLTSTILDEQYGMAGSMGNLLLGEMEWVVRGRATIPADAPVSFFANNNRLRWLIRVKRTFADGVEVVDAREFVVAPSGLDTAALMQLGWNNRPV